MHRLLFIGILFCTACKKTTNHNNVSYVANIVLPEKIIIDTNYGAAALQTLDLYLPKGRNVSITPLLVLIHAGQWMNGDKAQMQNIVATLKTRLPNFAFASINYRLASNNNNLFPTQENDVIAALQFLNQNASSFDIANYLITYGENAGGHLALLSAAKLGKPTITASIAINAPTDLVDIYNSNYNADVKAVLQQVTGTTPSSSTIYNTSSPINAVRYNCPSVLLFHSQNNNIIAPSQANQLISKLNSFSINNTLHFLPNENNLLSPTANAFITNEVVKFLNNKLLYR